MRIDQLGRLLVGTTDPEGHKLSTSNNPLIQLESADSNDYGRMSLIYNGNNGVGPGFWFGKSRGTTIGSNVGVADGDQLGGMFFHAADGDDKYGRAAAIVCYADGTQGTNITPGKIEFSTTGPGAAATTQRMLITSTGYVTTPTQFHIVVQRSTNQTGYNPSQGFGTGIVYNVAEVVQGTTSAALNTSNGRVTVPVDGLYLLEASGYSDQSVFTQGWFIKNGSRMAFSDFMDNSGNSQTVNCVGVQKLSANDEIGYKAYGSGSTSTTIVSTSNHTWMKITLLG